MRILAIDHGTRRMGIAISDELKTIAQPLEFIPAEPFAAFVTRLQQIIVEKPVELILVGMPRNMDGTYGPAAEKVKQFIAALRQPITIPIRTWTNVSPPLRPTASSSPLTSAAATANKGWTKPPPRFSCRAI